MFNLHILFVKSLLFIQQNLFPNQLTQTQTFQQLRGR